MVLGYEMHFSFIFLVMVGVATPRKTTTVEELGEEINKLKMNFEKNKMKMDETLEAIKLSGQHSSSCAYEKRWTSRSTVTYSKFLLKDKNFDLHSGRYTAGVKGVYRLDLSIGAIWSNRKSNYADIYIQRTRPKGKRESIDESRIYSHIDTTGTGPNLSHESGSRSLMIGMEKGEYVTVWVETVDTTRGLEDIIFCVSLVHVDKTHHDLKENEMRNMMMENMIAGNLSLSIL